MIQPSVCAVCLTADRPEMLARAVQSFRAQTYASKRLLIANSGSQLSTFALRDAELEWAMPGWGGQSVGTLRNAACSFCALSEACSFCALSDIFIHWDDDDISHPNRIAEQVELLQSSGADVVGYNECLFWRACGEAYLYRNPNPGYAIGASLCYWRRTWEAKPFPDLNVGEDTAWIAGLKVCGVSSLEGQPRPWGNGKFGAPAMVCTIHGANTNQRSYDTLMSASRFNDAQGQFRRVPEWDRYCREACK